MTNNILRTHNRNSGPVSFKNKSDIYTKSLLHFNNVNNSTVFTCEKGKIWNPSGGTKIVTSNSKFGGSSAEFNGTTTMLWSPGSNPDFAFPAGVDFYIGFFIKIVASGAYFLFDYRDVGANGNFISLYMLSDGFIRFHNYGVDRILSATAIVPGTFYHVALSRLGTSTKLFINGVNEGVTYSDPVYYIPAINRPIIGYSAQVPGTAVFNGWMDELIIKKGIGYDTISIPTVEYEKYP